MVELQRNDAQLQKWQTRKKTLKRKKPSWLSTTSWAKHRQKISINKDLKSLSGELEM